MILLIRWKQRDEDCDIDCDKTPESVAERFGDIYKIKYCGQYRCNRGAFWLAFGGNDVQSLVETMNEELKNLYTFSVCRVSEFYTNGFENEADWISGYVQSTKC